MGDAARPPRAPTGEGPGAGTYAGLGLQFAISILLFLWVGQWLDRKLGTSPIFLLVFVFLGGGAAFYSIYRKLMGIQEREEQAKRGDEGR